MQGCFSFLRSMAPKAERTVTVHPTVPFLNKATKVHGALVFASGQLGMREPGKLVPGGVQAEADQALKNLADVLAEAGSDIRRCLKVNIFLADIADFNAFNEVYVRHFPDPAEAPARTCLQAGALPLQAKVELEAVAAAGA